MLSGTAYWSGPIRGATVVVHQLVDGQRTLELARTTTSDDGAWSVNHDGYEHVEIDVIGGSYTEAAGGEVTLDANTTLRGVALDLTINEQRTGVTISPWTHLAVVLGRSRWVSGSKEPMYGAAVTKAIERLTNHLGFDPTKTAVAPVSASAGSPTEQVKYGLSLAGLSEAASLIATDQGATVQSINTVELTKVLTRDAGSAEALFDGNGSELLFVGASCPPPSGCSMEGPGCYASCAVHTNTLRSRLGSAVLAFLLTPENRTTLTRDDVAPWLEAVRANVDADLFGTETTEPFDSLGPIVTWVTPTSDATVAGTIAVEVTAADPVGVMSLTVTAETPSPMQLVDTDPAPERFAAQFSTIGIAEGALTLTATATDTEENSTSAPRMINLNNVSGGTVSGVVYKGRVGAATVRVYQFTNGVRGAQVGSGTTASDGSFTNVMIADGTSGPLLVEAGFGGTYPEEAATATVTLDVNDRLRTIIPIYADGGAISGLVASPLTSFAVTYFEYLQQTSQGGATFVERWTTARTAMESHFGVANIYSLTPLAPSEMTTFNAQARYGMILVGLSETARTASTLGGGDGGTFGSAMNAMRVFRVLETDLADGCWDGRQGPTQLYFGGTRAVTVRAVRRDLANQIVSYLNDGARNQTPYAGAADILSQLDTLSDGGGNTAVGSCSATGMLNPDAGTPFDQTRPVVAFNGATPAAGFIRGSITVDAIATDDLDTRPTLRFTSPMSTADADGDETDSDSHHTWDTTMLPDGPLVVTLEAVDDAGNVSDPALSTRTFTVDNTGPVINISGVTDGNWYPAPGVTPTFSATEANLASLTATLDGNPYSSGVQVSAAGEHVLVVTAVDQAGAMATRTVTFYVDPAAPTLTLTASNPMGTVVRQTLSLTVIADDNLKALGSLATNIAVTATGPGGAIVPTMVTPSVLADMRRQIVVTFDTAALADGTLTVRFNVSDRAGTPATELVVVRTMDNTAPTISITGANQGAYYQPPHTITFSASDTNLAAPASATLDGSSFATGASVVAQGGHTLIVAAADSAGNMTTVTRTFTTDGTAPVLSISGVASGGYYQPPVTITYAATDTNLQGVSATLDGNPFASGTQVSSEGSHTLVVTGVDRAGNTTSETRTFVVDGTPPTVVIGGVTNGAFYQNPVTITFSQSDANPGTTTATLDGSMFTSNQTVSTDGIHTLRVTATDRAGNTTIEQRVFTVDTQPPVVTFGATTPAHLAYVRQTVSVSATATDNVDTTPVVSLSSAPAGLIDQDGNNANASASGSLNTTTVPDGALTVTAQAVDDSGRIGSASRMYTVDNTPPVISVGGVTNAWYQAERTITITQGTEANPGPIVATLNGAPITSPHVVSAEGNYTLVVNTTDLAGNPAAAVNITFHIDLGPPDVAFGGSTPGPDAHVRQTISISATATDTLDPVPVVSLSSSPAGLSDQDGNTANASATGTINTSALSDGTLSVTAQAVDDSGRTNLVTRTFTVDNTLPEITINNVSNNGWYNTNRTITYSSNEAGPISAVLDGITTFNSGDTVTAEGPHSLEVTATDLAGNIRPQTVSFTIDKTVPILTVASSPAGTYVNDAVTFTATATDNFMGMSSLASNIVATAVGTNGMIAPTMSMPTTDANGTRRLTVSYSAAAAGEGTLTVTFSIADRATNPASVAPAKTIDTIAPSLTWPQGGLVLSNGTYWTNASAPTFSGAVSDANLNTVVVEISDGMTTVTRAATVNAGVWSVTLPAGDLPALQARTVTVRATDLAGNPTTIGRTVNYDNAGATLTQLGTDVRDERSDAVTFDAGTSLPSHNHNGTSININAATTTSPTCVDVYKYAYLMQPTSPAGNETTGGAPGPNPFRWSFQASDVGVGIDPANAEWRVMSSRAGTWSNWFSLGAGTGSGNVVWSFNPYRTDVPELGTHDGRWDIEFRARDRFGTLVTASRCWTHHPLGAPTDIQGSAGIAGNPVSTTEDQAYDALHALRLADNEPISGLVNSNHPGAALMKVEVRNGTQETVYITLRPEGATGATMTRRWSTTHIKRSQRDEIIACDEFSTNSSCLPVPATSTDQTSTGTTLTLGVRVWDLTANMELSPVACSDCAVGEVRFLFGARNADGTPRRFLVTGTTKGWTGLGPTGGAPPASELQITSMDSAIPYSYTGNNITTSIKYCLSWNAGDGDDCGRTATYGNIRALGTATLSFTGALRVHGSSSPSTTSQPVAQLGEWGISPIINNYGSGWSSTETDFVCHGTDNMCP